MLATAASRRLSSGKTMQRQVPYLAEINSSQRQAWRKTLEVFDETAERFRPLSVFPDDRAMPAKLGDCVQVKLNEMELRNARSFGSCWLGCPLWRKLELDRFWAEKLESNREDVPCHQVLERLSVNRLIDPGCEFRVHRLWFQQSAMGELLGAEDNIAGKDRLYRCLDRLLPHKEELFLFLRRRWHEMFNARFDILLYDLTSAYLEGQAEEIPRAKRGYSGDGRPDCLQLVIALVVTPDGFPLA